MSKRDPYGINAVLNSVIKDTTVQCHTMDEDRKRTKSFNTRIIGGVVKRAKEQGVKLEMEEEKEFEPWIQPEPQVQKKPSKTVLPSHGTRRVEHGLKVPRGIFAIVHEMQELDDSAFLLLYLEASREYEDRTGDNGWTNNVMEHVMSRCMSSHSVANETANETLFNTAAETDGETACGV